jgi:uncharacterized protein
MQDLDYSGERDKTREVGKTIATERFPNTADSFWLSVSPNTVINPFDFVTVKHIFDTKTIGLVKELQAIDAAGIVARVVVMANTGVEKSSGRNGPIGMPVGAGRPVNFSNEKEVTFALGIPEMANPIPSGIIEMTNGLRVPVSLDTSYLLGPDTAHINAAGISGNQKTSYLLFLLQATYQRLMKDQDGDAAVVIFNTKDQDLLHLDKKKHVKNKKLFDLLDLEIEPFSKVYYFLPRGSDGEPNSTFVPTNAMTFSYGLEDVYDRLDLLFDLPDRQHNVSSILNFIYEAWPIKTGSDKVATWKDLLDFKDYPQEVVPNRSTVFHFLGSIQRILKSPMFTNRKVRSRYLGKEIMKLKSGDVFVIDIAMLPTVEEQGFVVGDVMKSIDQVYSARRTAGKSPPKTLLIFIDEINRFVPRQQPGSQVSPVTDQIMRAVVAGRSRGTILFSAQQFKSAVNPSFHENVGMHVIAKLGASELSTSPYSMLDDSTKMNIVRLNRGELVMVHPAFRHPIKVIFPKVPLKTG